MNACNNEGIWIFLCFLGFFAGVLLLVFSNSESTSEEESLNRPIWIDSSGIGAGISLFLWFFGFPIVCLIGVGVYSLITFL